MTVPSLTNMQTIVKVTGNSPTGTATLFLDGTYTSAPGTLVGGQAQLSYYLGPIGAHTVIAKYNGDPKNLPSQTSTPLIVVQNGFAYETLNATNGLLNRPIQFSITVQ